MWQRFGVLPSPGVEWGWSRAQGALPSFSPGFIHSSCPSLQAPHQFWKMGVKEADWEPSQPPGRDPWAPQGEEERWLASPPAKPCGHASSSRPPSAGSDPRRICFLPPFQIKKTIHFISLIFQMEVNWPCWQVPDGRSLPPPEGEGARLPPSSCGGDPAWLVVVQGTLCPAGSRQKAPGCPTTSKTISVLRGLLGRQKVTKVTKQAVAPSQLLLRGVL